MVRAVNPLIQAGERWSFRQTTPLLLAHAVKHYGWGFIPNQGRKELHVARRRANDHRPTQTPLQNPEPRTDPLLL